MGFGDKLKDLQSKAKQSVAEHAGQITNAVESVGVVANEKTKGKYANKIQKFGDKTTGAVDKFAAGAPEGADGADGAEATQESAGVEETDSAAAPTAQFHTPPADAAEPPEEAAATTGYATPTSTDDPNYEPPSFS